MSDRLYAWGEKVWVKTTGHGVCPGLVIGIDKELFPWIAYKANGCVGNANFPLRDIAPRDDDSEPAADHIADASKMIEPAFDPVVKARHYNVHPSGVECITIAKHMNFCLGSVLKYIWRVDDKEVPIQDLRKAIQFLEYEIERRQEMETHA